MHMATAHPQVGRPLSCAFAVLLVAWLLVACEKAPGHSPDPACDDEELEDLGVWLRALEEEGKVVSAYGSKLVHIATPPADAAMLNVGPWLNITRGAISCMGISFGDIDGTQVSLARDDLARTLAATPGNGIVAVIEPDAPWALIAPALDVARQSGRPVVFAMESQSQVTPPPPSKLDSFWRAQTKIPPGERLAQPVEFEGRHPLDHVFARCPQARNALVWPRMEHPYIDPLLAGLRDCRCDVDFDEVRAMHWSLFGRYGRFVIGVPARLRAGEGPYSPEATWRTIAASLASESPPRELMIPDQTESD